VKSYQQLFAELKRRHVFRVAAVYGAVAFALIQVADPLTTALRLPDAFLTYVVAVLLLGFPLALVLAWAFEATPDGVRKTEPAAPGEIAAIVAEPAAQRWSAGLLALLGVAALVAGAWWVGRRSGTSDAATAASRGPEARLAFTALEDDPRPSIAVLPFADMSPQGDQEYFSDGMTEELLNTLAKIQELRVAARTSTFALKGTNLTAGQLGDTLHVRYFVEGSVRKAGDRLRITAQLIDTSTGSHLWTDTYDRTLDDVFAIQTEIAEAIADQLRVPLGLEGDESLVAPTGDLDAYDLYLAGRAQMRLRGEGLREAIRLFETAVEHDSAWAPAWAALAEAREISLWHARSLGVPEDSLQVFVDSALVRSERAARRALELDPRNASALVALGSVQRDRAEWAASEASYRQALGIDPDNAEAHQQYADLMYNMGRIADAVREADRAWALDPAPIRAETLSWALELDDRVQEAADVNTASLAVAPGQARERLLSVSVLSYLRAGKLERALDSMDELVASSPRYASLSSKWGDVRTHLDASFRGLMDGSDPAGAEAASALDSVLNNIDNAVIPPTLAWMMIGEPDSAVVALLRDETKLLFGRTAIFWHPLLDPVRSDPRVQAWLAERGLGGVEVRRTPVDERRTPMILRERESARGP
jgi:TolB-like protein